MTKRELLQELRGVSGDSQIFMAIAGTIEPIHDIYLQDVRETKRRWFRNEIKQVIIGAEDGEYSVLGDSSGKFYTVRLFHKEGK